MIKYIDLNNTYIDSTVEIGDGTIIYPNVIVEGNTKIGNHCVIHMGSYVKDTIVGDDTVIYHSHIECSKIGNDCKIGPYAYIRPNCIIKDHITIGSFVELKNSKIEDHSRIPHLSYIGDTEIGKNVNIGCGVVTANYDGKKKHHTIIKDGAFIGCNVNLIAPITISEHGFIGAGSTITNDVPADTLVVERSKTVMKKYKEDC